MTAPGGELLEIIHKRRVPFISLTTTKAGMHERDRHEPQFMYGNFRRLINCIGSRATSVYPLASELHQVFRNIATNFDHSNGDLQDLECGAVLYFFATYCSIESRLYSYSLQASSSR